MCLCIACTHRKLVGKVLNSSAGTLLKQALMRYYAASSEHCKRLISPECNDKFRCVAATVWWVSNDEDCRCRGYVLWSWHAGFDNQCSLM